MSNILYKIKEEDIGKRIDLLVKEVASISRSLAEEIINDGLVLLNKQKVKKSVKPALEDILEITLPQAKELDLTPKNLDLDIIYEDDYLAIVNKPYNLVVHPSSSSKHPTLVHGLLYQLNSLSQINGVFRPGIVHRIDKDTSGLLMIAKNDVAHQHLSKQLSKHSIKRVYIALVYGVVKDDAFTINCPLSRSTTNRLMVAPNQEGKEAITHVKVLRRWTNYTLISCNLETGRTHQIRAHLKFVGHPLVGDPLYGPAKRIGTRGQYLHAQIIGFIHPKTDEYLEFNSPLPEEFAVIISRLDKEEVLV